MYSLILLQFSDQIKNRSSTHSHHLPKGLTLFQSTSYSYQSLRHHPQYNTQEIHQIPKTYNSNLFLQPQTGLIFNNSTPGDPIPTGMCGWVENLILSANRLASSPSFYSSLGFHLLSLSETIRITNSITLLHTFSSESSRDTWDQRKWEKQQLGLEYLQGQMRFAFPQSHCLCTK